MKELAEQVRKICSRFPVVEEKIDAFGHLSFRVKDKPFIMMGEDADYTGLSIKTSKTTQEVLLESKPEVYSKTAYIGQHGWVSTKDAQGIDWSELEQLIEEAYLRTAPKSVLKELNN